MLWQPEQGYEIRSARGGKERLGNCASGLGNGYLFLALERPPVMPTESQKVLTPNNPCRTHRTYCSNPDPVETVEL